MIAKITYGLVSCAMGVVLGIVFAVTWPQEGRVPTLIKIEKHISHANDIRMWQCTKEEFTEYRRACTTRKRMELVKPKE